MSATSFYETTLPACWDVVPLKAVAWYSVSNVNKVPDASEEPVRLCNYTDVYKNEFINSAEMEFMRSTATEYEIKKFGLVVGDVIITKDSETWEDIAVPALVVHADDDFVCGYHLAMLRPMPDRLDGRFLFRCLQSKAIRLALELASTGVTRYGLPKGDIGKLRLPLPSLSTQANIAAYLDRETLAIDTLISEKESMLGLLEEKRQALVSHAVTQGLNPKAKMKSTGIEWLGEVPTHWELWRLKFLATVQTGLTIGKNYGKQTLHQYFYLRVANVQDGYLDLDKVTTVEVTQNDAESCLLQTGDVLMNEGGDIDKLGRGCVWQDEVSPCLHQNHVFCVRPHSVNPNWLTAFTASTEAKMYFETRAKRTTNLASISSSNVRELTVPMPPEVEQEQILGHVSKENQRLDEVRESMELAIRLLKERRSALITAAVTGQIRMEIL